MGFPSICYSIIFPKPFVIIIFLLDRVKFALSLIVLHLGGFGYSDGQVNQSSAPYIFVPSSSIKRRLRIVRFGSFSEESRNREDEDVQCAVCLEILEANHEIRELGNCPHTFHVECIDEWVDVGQVTCPLCRAELLPNSVESKQVNLDP